MAWAGLTSRTIIGPFFFSQNVTASSYKEMLQTWVIPRLHVEGLLSTVWWQQDGAPAHSAQTVRQFLDDTFGHRWIGRGGPMEWPARSPDMNPLDFFLWGYLKRRVYKVKPTCVEELKRSIVEECRAISVDALQRVIANSIRRMLLCQQNGGGHFEHLLR
ncbi:unnamed protein product [Dicrocoelium dendriticum]|nr:unnamed protein product [Dicrocoelium dendriticum]